MIRLGTHQDLTAILELIEEAKSSMREQGNPQWDEHYPLSEHFEEDLEQNHLYVLEENATIYGFIVIDQNQAEWYDELEWPVNREGAYVIHRLTGSKAYKGAATQLLEFVFDYIRDKGVNIIITDTFALNKPAQGLFSKFGFHKVGEQKMDYHPYDKGDAFYAYYKNLNE